MISEYRQRFNSQYSTEKYQQLLKELEQYFGISPGFRVAESPVFLPTYLKERLVEASNEIMSGFMDKEYLTQSLRSIPDSWNAPGNSNNPNFIVLDYAITLDDNGLLKPMLIEGQGFPSVYFFQMILDKAFRNVYDIPDNVSAYFDNQNADSFLDLLRKVIIADNKAEDVILLELEPQKQTTLVDFIGAKKMLGISTVCVSDIIKEGKELYYLKEGSKQKISRIFNRVIADDWEQRPDIKSSFKFIDDLNVSWAGHPNWFFRISKFGLPYLDSQYVPQTTLLSELKEIPHDLENYVLKPLFSFSGTGVIFDVIEKDINEVNDPENYILQKKIVYHPGIQSPTEPVKCEVRVMLVWPDGYDKPIFTTNLTRLSKGALIGVKFNKDKDWVGGSLSYFV